MLIARLPLRTRRLGRWLAVSWLALAAPLRAETLDSYPDWSPNGEWIVFSSTRAGRQDLYKIRPDGSGLTQLTDTLHHDTYPVWSPDGTAVLFTRVHAAVPPKTVELYVVDADGSNERRLTEGPGNKFMGTWCRGGAGIVYSGDRDGSHDIYGMRPDGSEVVNLTRTPDRDEANPSCRGTRVLYDVGIEDQHRIQQLDLKDGAEPSDLIVVHTPWDANWSPDGQRIAVGVYHLGAEKMSVVGITDAEGKELHQVTPPDHNAFWPSWSPDGRFLVFSYGAKPFSAGRLYVSGADGSELRPLEAE